MAETKYLLTESAVHKIAQDHTRLMHQVRNLRKRLDEASKSHTQPELYIGKTSGAVLEFTGGTIPTGTVQRYRKSPSGALASFGAPIEVSNMAGAVAANQWVAVARDTWGTWWFIVEKC